MKIKYLKINILIRQIKNILAFTALLGLFCTGCHNPKTNSKHCADESFKVRIAENKHAAVVDQQTAELLKRKSADKSALLASNDTEEQNQNLGCLCGYHKTLAAAGCRN